jgi:hypothetical protein
MIWDMRENTDETVELLPNVPGATHYGISKVLELPDTVKPPTGPISDEDFARFMDGLPDGKFKMRLKGARV